MTNGQIVRFTEWWENNREEVMGKLLTSPEAANLFLASRFFKKNPSQENWNDLLYMIEDYCNEFKVEKPKL